MQQHTHLHPTQNWYTHKFQFAADKEYQFMAKTLPNTYLISLVHLNRQSSAPLYRQLCDSLRAAILKGQLEPGVCLPSSRDMAETLEVSRNTVLNAFDLLIAEGYLEPREGSGTYVSKRLNENPVLPKRDQSPQVVKTRLLSSRADRYRQIAQRGAAAGNAASAPPKLDAPFMVGLPDLAAFPAKLWAQVTAQHARALSPRHFAGQALAGYRPLQEVIAAYLNSARALHCTPEQIIITAGTQGALRLALDVLLNEGDAVWMESPGYMSGVAAIYAAGGRLFNVPVDAEGIDVEAGMVLASEARLAYVTPSHQFPTGVTMSLDRRFKLLQWAERVGAWIIEDDYDSEYRYSGPPLAALQGLDSNGHVLYMGTFSKVLFPSLRLGYLVVPSDLVEVFHAARWTSDQHPPLLQQIVVADFMIEGHFTRHIRRMRTHYMEKRNALVTAADDLLGDLLRFEATDAGLHVTGWLPEGVSDTEVAGRARECGVMALPVSRLSIEPSARPGLVLGFGNVPLDAIRSGVEKLAQALEYL
jgi:GntR family transcriptional regulator / MocR family aminotransferase